MQNCKTLNYLWKKWSYIYINCSCIRATANSFSHAYVLKDFHIWSPLVQPFCLQGRINRTLMSITSKMSFRLEERVILVIKVLTHYSWCLTDWPCRATPYAAADWHPVLPTLLAVTERWGRKKMGGWKEEDKSDVWVPRADGEEDGKCDGDGMVPIL